MSIEIVIFLYFGYLIRLINTKLILLFCYFICHKREEILNMIFLNAFSFPDVCYLRKFLTDKEVSAIAF